MNFSPIASNLPPSIIFLFASSSYLESFISGCAAFIYASLDGFF